MRLRVFGIPTVTGAGTHSNNIFNVLKRMHGDILQVEWYNNEDLSKVQGAYSDSQNSDINIFLYFIVDVAPLFKGRKYFWYAFESTKPMHDLNLIYDQFDFVITPSKWGYECLTNNGAPKNRTFVIPEGVNSWQFHPFLRPLNKDKSITRFLMIGKFENRKGYYEGLKAFAYAYEKKQNIELWTKPDMISGPKAQIGAEYVNYLRELPDLPIQTYTGLYSLNQMRRLYYACDFFLFPSKCEGWGLPLIEALACGIPCIACNFGGQSEFLRLINDDYISIPYKLNDINCEIWKKSYPQKDNFWGKWAEIDPIKLSEILIEVCDKDFSKSAIKSSKIIRENFSWEQSASKLLDLIFKN